MILALDTNVLVELLRRRPNPLFRQRLDAAFHSGAEIRVSAVALHELMVGAFRSERPGYHLERIEALTTHLTIDAWTAEDALLAAKVRAQLDTSGQPIGLMDSLIAGHAMRCDAALVTGNLRHFVRVHAHIAAAQIGGLRLIDWAVSDQPLDPAAIFANLRRPQED